MDLKTAIVKTSFWDDEDFNSLHTDTKLVYTYLLTSPGHGLSGVIKINRNVMVAQTGYNKDTIELALQQLVEAGWILVLDKYVRLTHDHIEAKKGRFTEQAIERELLEMPSEVVEKLYRYDTGTVPVHNNINKNNNINNNKVAIKTKAEIAKVDENATRLSKVLETSIHQNFEFVKPKVGQAEQWATDIDKINRIDGYSWEVIEAVLKWSQEDSFWKQNIRSGSKLRKQFERLLISVKTELDKNKSHAMEVL